MTVVNDDFAYFADRVLVDEIVSGVIAAIPSGLVVDEHGDFGGACGTLDGAAVFDTYGERFFHHHWDAVPGANFCGAAVAIGIGVDQDGLRVSSRDHFVEIGMVQIRIEGEFGGVAIEERAVRLRDANDLYVVAIFSAREESLRMAVRESGHGHAQRSCWIDSRSGRLRPSFWNYGQGKNSKN
jgi:hypothetical protein